MARHGRHSRGGDEVEVQEGETPEPTEVPSAAEIEKARALAELDAYYGKVKDDLARSKAELDKVHDATELKKAYLTQQEALVDTEYAERKAEIEAAYPPEEPPARSVAGWPRPAWAQPKPEPKAETPVA